MDFVIENGVLKKYTGTSADVIIPDGVTEIGDRAFCGCSSLSSIEIAEGITSIGDSAFKDCSSLSNVEIPENTIQIGVGIPMSGSLCLRITCKGKTSSSETAFWSR